MTGDSLTISVPDEEIDDLRRRLKATRFPDDPANEEWAYGTNAAFLAELVEYWIDGYDWRSHEKGINELHHHRRTIDDVPLHFVFERGRGPDPVPLVLTHGWPWTFWDFRKVIGPLSDPAAFGGDPRDAFDVIVPSLPGFVFSAPLRRTGIGFSQTADILKKLVVDELGIPRFAVHGADWGMIIAETLGHRYEEHVLGLLLQGSIHLDYFTAPGAAPEDYGPDEQDYPAHNARHLRHGLGYMGQQTTKPQTVGYALDDSPAGLCAWMLEKRVAWSDSEGDPERRFTKDDLLTAISLYWFTRTATSSARFYYESAHNLWSPSHERTPVVDVPTGVLQLRGDILMSPRAWAERYFDLRRWTVRPSGGHWGAFEEPDTVVTEIREMFRPLRSGS